MSEKSEKSKAAREAFDAEWARIRENGDGTAVQPFAIFSWGDDSRHRGRLEQIATAIYAAQLASPLPTKSADWAVGRAIDLTKAIDALHYVAHQVVEERIMKEHGLWEPWVAVDN